MFNLPHLSENPQNFSQCGVLSVGPVEPIIQIDEEKYCSERPA